MIDTVDVRLLSVPLTTPYRLAFGPVDHYDTILVELTATDAPVRVPILGLLQGEDEAELSEAFARLHAEGCRTIKVKVG
ncbi:MAG: hypothetical protein ABI349_01515, partial [Casimicrobiaceae bacterium]